LRREGFYIGFRKIVARLPQKSPVTKAVIRPAETAALVASRKWQQGNVPGLLDSASQTALVGGANPRQTARDNLSAFCHKPLQQTNIAVRDGVNLFGAEFAHLFAAEELAAAAGPAGPPGTPSWPPARTTLSTLSALSRTALGWCCACLGRLRLCFVCHDVPLLSC
jgi:hypothetical protein